MTENKFSWNLPDIKKIHSNGKKVFSCFHGGGGSTMGYKLSGYTVLGGVEIDKKMMQIYRENHNPILSYLMSVGEFNKKNDLPKELYNLDILDGSPPCSSFSMTGKRQKVWGRKIKFREGQAAQVLDELFFHFIETAKKLKPKIVIAENVKGILHGNARGFVKQIIKDLESIGYIVQIFLLNAAFMDVPQRRERVFFIAHKNKNMLNLKFNNKPINLKDVLDKKRMGKLTTNKEHINLWMKCQKGNSLCTVHPKGYLFNWYRLNDIGPTVTLTSSNHDGMFYWDEPRVLSEMDIIRVQTFPDDFNFLDQDPQYVCGMSVPPKMMMNLSKEIYRQLL